MAPPTSFAALLTSAQQGDPLACADLWRRYSPAVATFARFKGSSEPDDLASEVFLAAFRELPRFTGEEGAFKGYLFTIAHRRVVDELRRRSRRVVTVPWEESSDARWTSSAEETALESDGAARALTLLAQLAPDQREVLVLRIFADLTVDQIATIVGKSNGAVKALQRRGLEALRRKLDHTRTTTTSTGDRRELR